MNVLVAVAAGGAVGATLRYLVGLGVGRWLGTAFPWATLLVNVAGCLVMGVLAGLLALHWSPGPALRNFLSVGVLGGFTTFSAFSLDVTLLFERGAVAHALAYVAASVLLSIGALVAGQQLVRVAG